MIFPIFDFKHLIVELIPQYKAIIIKLNGVDENNYLNVKTIKELSHMFQWLKGHIEVATVLITAENKILSRGLDPNEYKKMSLELLDHHLYNIRKLIHEMFTLPQTIIIDLKSDTCGVALELALGADLRIAHYDVNLEFNHLKNAITPSCGACGILDKIVGHANAKNWILNANSIDLDILLNSGFIYEYYFNPQETQQKILDHLSSLAPIPKIQAKKAQYEAIKDDIENILVNIPKLSLAGMSSLDWKKDHLQKNVNGKKDYMQPSEMADILRFKKRPTAEV